MKIAIKDLKKALEWIEKNSLDTEVKLEMAHDNRNLSIKCQDKYESMVDITLYNESTSHPKIKKEDRL